MKRDSRNKRKGADIVVEAGSIEELEAKFDALINSIHRSEGSYPPRNHRNDYTHPTQCVETQDRSNGPYRDYQQCRQCRIAPEAGICAGLSSSDTARMHCHLSQEKRAELLHRMIGEDARARKSKVDIYLTIHLSLGD